MKYLNFLYKVVSMALLAILLAYFGLLILDGFGWLIAPNSLVVQEASEELEKMGGRSDS